MNLENKQKFDVVIMGAGPAGLAAALRLSEKGKKVLVLEKDKQVGGISKTIEYKGYRFDLGGHRFFSKNDEVNNIWKRTLGEDFLVRPRLSRIYYKNKFFDYPVKIGNVFRNLGILDSLRVGLSYLQIKINPCKNEDNFKQWVSNRFGKKLYEMFFKNYTEKLWGISCEEIEAEWAAQRIKGLSLFLTIKNALFSKIIEKPKTLIDEFYYPKYGPGMMYEKMAENIVKLGGKIILNQEIVNIVCNGNKVNKVIVRTGYEEIEYEADHFISSVPITKLMENMVPKIPVKVLEAAGNLRYRSLCVVNLIMSETKNFPDNWIYVHSPEVSVLRIQNYGNWSPFMIPQNGGCSLSLEYFCNEGDEFWNMPEREKIIKALLELGKIGLGKVKDYVDGFSVRVPKAYPVYNKNYFSNIKIIKEHLKNYENLQVIGRYGMFKYNNMDHSILTGFAAADNILGGNHDIWKINSDEEYQEEK